MRQHPNNTLGTREGEANHTTVSKQYLLHLCFTERIGAALRCGCKLAYGRGCVGVYFLGSLTL